MFEVVSALESRKRRKRLRFATFSVAVHGLVLGSLVAASLWQVGDITPPEVVPIVFPKDPPPDGGGHGGPPPTNHVQQQVQRPPVRVQPVEIPPDVPSVLPPTELPPIPTDGPATTGGQTGRPGGPAGPGEGSPCLVNCGDSGPTTILRPGGEVRAPVGIYQPEPAYPNTARIARQQGVVILEAIIGTDGSVENLSVLKSAFPLLDEAAVSAVARWRYRPATLNGRTVRVYLTVTVNFTLR